MSKPAQQPIDSIQGISAMLGTPGMSGGVPSQGGSAPMSGGDAYWHQQRLPNQFTDFQTWVQDIYGKMPGGPGSPVDLGQLYQMYQQAAAQWAAQGSPLDKINSMLQGQQYGQTLRSGPGSGGSGNPGQSNPWGRG